MNTDYVRTDTEIAHQRAYEAKETERHKSTVQIAYRIEEISTATMAKGSFVSSKNPRCWFLVRQVSEGREERSAPFYRRVDVVASLRENIDRDRVAGTRLGVGIYTQIDRK
jgi:hypothetical protein